MEPSFLLGSLRVKWREIRATLQTNLTTDIFDD